MSTHPSVLEILLLGHPSTDVTAFREKYFKNLVEDVSQAMGFNMARVSIEVNNQPIYLHINHVDGKFLYTSVRHLYMKKSHIALLLFDHGSKESFEAIPKWLKEIQEAQSGKLIPFQIIGIGINKTKEVTDEEVSTFLDSAKQQTEQFNFIPDYIGIDTADTNDFTPILSDVIKHFSSYFPKIIDEKERIFDVHASKDKTETRISTSEIISKDDRKFMNELRNVDDPKVMGTLLDHWRQKDDVPTEIGIPLGRVVRDLFGIVKADFSPATKQEMLTKIEGIIFTPT